MDLSQEYKDFVNNYHGYNDIIRVWHRGFDGQNKAWIQEKLMPILLPKLHVKADSSELKVLSVGSGNGSFDLLLINALLKGVKEGLPETRTTFSWTVLEPNAASVQEFRNKTHLVENDVESVQFVWEVVTFEDFITRQQDAQHTQKYQLVTFVNSLYYVDEKVALKQSHNLLLEDQGVILIVKESEVSTTQKAFRLYVQRTGQTSRDGTPSKEILAELKQELGMAYEQFSAHIDVDITEMFQDGDPVGSALIQFLLHSSVDPRKTDAGADVLEFLKSESKSTEGGRVSIVKQQDVTLITKGPKKDLCS